jgi:hypothetical protein
VYMYAGVHVCVCARTNTYAHTYFIGVIALKNQSFIYKKQSATSFLLPNIVSVLFLSCMSFIR